jgi:hypothetical protein
MTRVDLTCLPALTVHSNPSRMLKVAGLVAYSKQATLGILQRWHHGAVARSGTVADSSTCAAGTRNHGCLTIAQAHYFLAILHYFE